MSTKRPFSRHGYSSSPWWLPWKVWIDLSLGDDDDRDGQRFATILRVLVDAIIAVCALALAYEATKFVMAIS
jgi:hypothetical protein